MTDFYSKVNQKWINETIIPDGHDRWGNFQILEKETNIKIKKIIDELGHDNQIKIIYEQNNDLRNYNLIQKIIQIIINTHNIFEFSFKFNILFNSPLEIQFAPDYNNSNYIIPHLHGSGLGLERNYYFSKDDTIRKKYIQFIKDYSKLFNLNLDADIIFNLEIKLADKTYTPVERRDPYKHNNVINFEQFKKEYPNLLFFNRICIKEINISNPNYTKLVNELINTEPNNNWKQYFIFRLILKFHKFINEDIEKCHFDFYEGTILGVKIMKPKWEQQIDIVNYYLGEQVGKLYVEKYFPVESKNKCLEMVNIMKKELYNYLKNKSWFEEETKIKALEKLNKMNIKIGFPDKYEKDYTKLKISRKNCLLKNILLIKRFNLLYEYDKLYKPNQKLWLMNPQIVNAYYSPNNNEIVFPAAILQEPFFSLEQDMAKNFGGIGCVIGHEITHAFDDEGSKFDADGNLKNWWTEKDKIEYKKITDKLKEQSEQFKLDEGKINGELTLGENIADLGGVNISLNALEHYYKNPSKEIYENFFTNYATVWRFKSTQNSMRKKLLTDPHSPPIFRVNGILKNIDKFDNSTKDKVKIWS